MKKIVTMCTTLCVFTTVFAISLISVFAKDKSTELTIKHFPKIEESIQDKDLVNGKTIIELIEETTFDKGNSTRIFIDNGQTQICFANDEKMDVEVDLSVALKKINDRWSECYISPSEIFTCIIAQYGDVKLMYFTPYKNERKEDYEPN